MLLLERNGYQPSSNSPYYPEDIQRAEQRAHNGTGGVSPGSSSAGSPAKPSHQDNGGNAARSAVPGNDMGNGINPGGVSLGTR
ncbi:hypothetical protein KQH58_13680 [Mycetohabitans sp. B6]|nr:hypothetical protein [Mycetohabitans sp. B6]